MNEVSSRKVALITGGTQGLGFEAARRLLHHDFHLVLHGRNEERGRAAVDALKRERAGVQVDFLAADLTSLAAVRAAAQTFRQRFGRLDLLVNNAAMSSHGETARKETGDGFELFFAANYLSHYLLTRLLLDLLLKNAPARIVTVGARQMGAKLDLSDPQMTRNWTPIRAITQAKLGLFAMTTELARRLDASKLTANLIDPGLVNTGYQKNAGAVLKLVIRLIGDSAEAVARDYEWVATAPELAGVSGKMFQKRKPVPLKGDAGNPELAARLWAESARWTGLPDALDALA
jgi:NAD(P)-dependent dehydrogenase (short-subunit alcohol dehydrogenase family)